MSCANRRAGGGVCRAMRGLGSVMRPADRSIEDLVGRDRQLDALADALENDRAVVLLGEAGAGKTTLMRAATSRSGRAVLEGGALATLNWMPYVAVERALGRKLPDADVLWVVSELEDVLGAGILLVDDLQWAHAATLDVIGTLAGRRAVVAAARSGDPATPSVRDHLIRAGFEVIDVPALDESDAMELARRRRPDLSRTALERVCRRAGGNPFFIEELTATPEPSESLRLAVRARLRALPEAVRATMAMLAVAGRPLPVGDLGDNAHSLVDAGLADVSQDLITARHALLGEIIADELDEEERREIDARLAELCADPGEAAHHWAAAGDRSRAYEAALLAAALATSPEQRAEHLGVAAASASGRAADTLRIKAAVALADVGRHDASDDLVRDMDVEDAEDRRRLHLVRARNAWALGDPTRAGAEIAGGLSVLGGDVSEARIGLVIEDARLRAFTGRDADDAIRRARTALSLASDHGVHEAQAQYVLGTAYVLAGSDEAVPYLAEAMRIARARGEHDTELRAGSNLVAAHQRADRGEEIEHTLDELIERARELRLLGWERTFRADSIMHSSEQGPYPEVIEKCEALLSEVLDPRTRSEIEGVLSNTLIIVGRLEEAIARIDSALTVATRDWMGTGRLLTAKASALFWGGRAREALAALDESMVFIADEPATTAVARALRAWICYDLGEDPGLPFAPTVEHARRHASDAGALKALHDGRPHDAAKIFERAIDESGLPVHRARALWGAGEAHRIAGDEAAAREHLHAAERLAENYGLRPLLRRIQRSLRLIGERRMHARAARGETLTPREREILALVGRGLTNTEIAGRLGLSRATVERHVANACAKLGATNRAQAALLAVTL